MLNEIFDKIYVINLDERTDRLEAFDKQAKSLGIQYERVPAIKWEKGKIPKADACKKSHQIAMKTGIDAGAKRIFIFEDDAEFCEDFNNKFKDFYAEIPQDWDMLYLGAWHLNFKRFKEGIVKMVRSHSAPAYGINTHYLDKCYRSTFHRLPVDLAMAEQHEQNKVYCPKPAFVIQTPGYSDLEEQYRDVTEHYL